MRVIDTNVLVYHLMGRSGELSRRSSGLFLRLKAADETAHLPVTAIFECIYTCQRSYQVPNHDLARLLLDIVRFPGVVVDHRAAITDALQLWHTQGPLSFADCYHLALTRDLGSTELYTFDRKMGRFPGVDRVEP